MKSLVCIDASIIIKALTPNELEIKAENLLKRFSLGGVTLVAPSHLNYEVTSTLRRLVYLKTIMPEEGDQAFFKYLRLSVKTSNSRKILSLAWKLAKEFNRPRAYDTAYLALAQLRECKFWTADKRIYNAVSHKLKWVRCLE